MFDISFIGVDLNVQMELKDEKYSEDMSDLNSKSAQKMKEKILKQVCVVFCNLIFPLCVGSFMLI